MKLVKLKCEGCGAILKVNEELKKATCNYCGTEFLVDDGSTKHTYRKIDEARIKEAEISEKIKLKELEIAEKRHDEELKTLKIMGVITLIGVFIMIVSLILASNSGNEEHWGYWVTLFLMPILGWMWIGKAIFNESKKKK